MRSHLLVVLGLLVVIPVLGGCASPGGIDGAAAGPGSEATAVTEDDSRLQLRALLLLLVDRQIYDPFTVERALAGEVELRVEVARALGRIPNRRAVPVLVELAADESVAVRRAAVFALGEHEAATARSALLRRVGDGDAVTGRLAVEALAKCGVALTEVERALSQLSPPERRRRLLPALYRFDGHAALPVAVAALELDDRRLHRLAAYAMARDAVAEAAPHLRGLLDDADPGVRGWAARGLGEVGDGDDMGRLRPLLADEAAGPIIRALRAGRRLVDRGEAAAVDGWRAPLLELVEDRRPGVRLTAVEVAGSWARNGELGGALLDLVHHGVPRARQLALVALAEGEHPRAGEETARAVEAADPELRTAAAAAAAELGRTDLLNRLVEDPKGAVRAAALRETLDSVDSIASMDRAIAVERAAVALDDPDAGVRATALEWLAEHPELRASRLLDAVERSEDDLVLDARMAAVRALVARAEAGPRQEREAIVRRLERVARRGDYPVRREAIEGLEQLGAATPDLGAATERLSVADYRDIVRRTARRRRVAIETEAGELSVSLDCPRAPLTCTSFLALAEQGFYDGLSFHRVVPDFVVQGGDPRGDGRGGPGYTVRDEIGRLRYDRTGIVGMARAGPDSAGSQFFITLSAQPHLDGAYTAFGEVVAGAEVLSSLVQGDRIVAVREVTAE